MYKLYERIHDNCFLVKNHKWALLCWENYKKDYPNMSSILVHLDYHWDSGDYEGNVFELKNMSLKELQEHIEENHYITLDGFITPAVIRNTINEVHFFCCQDKEALDSRFLKNISYTYTSIEQLVETVKDKNIILDIDLDLFNYDAGNGYWDIKANLWDEQEIKDFIISCSPLIKQADCITIAESPEYTGNKDDVVYLKNLIIPSIIDILNQNHKGES